MKAASGEANLTVITVVAIAAIATFFIGLMWPNVQKTINNTWETISNGEK